MINRKQNKSFLRTFLDIDHFFDQKFEMILLFRNKNLNVFISSK